MGKMTTLDSETETVAKRFYLCQDERNKISDEDNYI